MGEPGCPEANYSPASSQSLPLHSPPDVTRHSKQSSAAIDTDTMTSHETGALRLSTNALPRKDRQAIFQEEFARKILCVEFVDRSQDMQFDVELSRFGPVLAGRTDGTPSEFRRTRTSTGITPDSFSLLVSMRGRFHYAARGRESAIDIGEAVLINHGVEGVMQALDHGSTLTLLVERSAMLALVPGADDITGRQLPRTNPALGLLAGYLRSAQSLRPHTASDLPGLMGGHLLELIAHAIAVSDGREASRENQSVRAARLASVLADVERDACDVGFTLRTIAERHHVTPRYIQILLEPTGMSFTQHVVERRLQRAMTLLTDPLRAHLRVTDIALEAGFGDLPYFNRAFRRRFGDTPTGVRSMAITGWPNKR